MDHNRQTVTLPHPGAALPVGERPLWKKMRYAAFTKVARGRPQWLRVVMDRETDKLIDQLDRGRLRALEISGRKWERSGFRSYRSADYPAFDICEQALPERFDLIIAEQVFEHLLWPYRACRNVYTMLEPGGHFLVTTPFLVRVHDEPVDCSRWTALGLKYFLAECGFPLEQIQSASWGNRSCLRANLRVWTPYLGRLQSLRNEREYPLVVWALARK
jgi:SAM-dependent methyltransferase